MKDQYDVIVIGGGPAGCTAASLIAEAGHSTLLIEREKMPRFHVGESLMPEAYWPLQRLGLLDRMKNSCYVTKKSVQFVTATGKESEPFYFTEHDPRECSTTWQVERADFDQMMFERAAELGADCYDSTRVMEILMDEGEVARGVRVKLSDGTMMDVHAKVVIDGSGQQSLIAHQLGIREENPKLKKAAIWGYWKDARRDAGDNSGATIIMQTIEKDSWFWFIPLSNGITSIGCVGDNDYMLKRGCGTDEVYQQELEKCPGLQSRLENSEMVGKLHVAKEYSYWTKKHAGEGWVLIGDAFGFIDPIYSSGVYFALVMGEKAADAVIAGLAKGDLSGVQLGRWCDEFKEGAQWIRKLVEAFYTKEFSFGSFMKANPNFRGNLTDLLIGRIFYDGVGDIFGKMDPVLERAGTDGIMMG
jgi:flavin-dependent dehydrogenase